MFHGKKVIFLDIDGVLHALNEDDTPVSLFSNLPIFENILRNFNKEEVVVVISSAWRIELTLDEIKEKFSSDIASMVVGVTEDKYGWTSGGRLKEILLFCEKNNIAEDMWCAIDDKEGLFHIDFKLQLVHPNLILTDKFFGFTDFEAKLLNNFLIRKDLGSKIKTHI